MKSVVPKVMFPVLGKPMLFRVVEKSFAVADAVVVVLGHDRETIEPALMAQFPTAKVVYQISQDGTGGAVKAALPYVDSAHQVLVLCGDVPLISTDAMRAAMAGGNSLGMLTCQVQDPHGYGRILRDAKGEIVGIREEKDASHSEKKITEVNPGVFCAPKQLFEDALMQGTTKNAQGELYLTDVVPHAVKHGIAVASRSWVHEELQGVNDRAQLSQLESTARRNMNIKWAQAGVTIRDLDLVTIEEDVLLAEDVVIETGAVLRGKTSVGKGSKIDVGVVLENTQVAERVWIKPYSVATDCVIGDGAFVGPFAHLRPASVLGPDVHIGNFVETKKTTLGRGSKANHLAYLGDGVLGERVNVGAGTIFCNYDGAQKHTTILEDDVFIGSDSHLVAPVTVGKGAYVATGTTVTKNVPADALAIARTKQDNKEGYASRLRARQKMLPQK